jgi:hypothetical protein
METIPEANQISPLLFALLYSLPLPSFTLLQENGGQIFFPRDLEREIKRERNWNSGRSSSGEKAKKRKRKKDGQNETSKTCYSIIIIKLSLLKVTIGPFLFFFVFFFPFLFFFYYLFFSFEIYSSYIFIEVGEKEY